MIKFIRTLGFKKPSNPILGMVLAGEVDSVGKDVKSFKNGDQVYAINIRQFGAYAEYTCWPESVIAKKPSDVSYEEASSFRYGGLIAWYYLKKGNIQSEQNILIYGASGAVGTSAVQLARYYGAKITGVCSTANLEFVRSLGAELVIDYTKEEATKSGEYYDFALDAVGKRKNSNNWSRQDK